MLRRLAILPILILLISIPILIDTFTHQGMFFAHDIEQNIARFGAFYKTLSEGNIPPQWADGIANGYGGPILIFSYSIPYYIATIFRLFGFDLVTSMKLLIAFVFIGSGVTMFYWLKQHVQNIAAFGGTLLYLYAPYRISDIYARGSIPEQTAFVFVPLVLFGLFTLFRAPSKKTVAFLALSLSLLFLSHPFFIVIFTPLFFLYSFYLFKQQKKKIRFLPYPIFSLILTTGITAFSLIPLQLEIKYTHYDISPFNGREFYTQYNTFPQLILPVWSFLGKYGTREYITYQLGLVHWGVFFLSLPLLIRLWKKKERLFPFAVVAILGFLLSLFFMLPPSFLVYSVIRPLQQIQFPWRFLALSTTSLAIIYAILLESTKTQKVLLFCLTFIATLILYLPFAKGHDYTYRKDSYYLTEFETNTEGPGTQPRWAANPENYARPSHPIEIIEGKGVIIPVKRDTTHHIFEVTSETPVRIVDNTFYFPGWTVAIDGNSTDIQFQDPDYRGLITFLAPQGSHTITVSFGPTKVRKLSIGISAATLLVTLLLLFPMKKRKA
ncbi:hypothetical protein HYW55_03415 [Candidatus Gottesmanbacteria bacterium]|nr:hypothetical protein [Candidatus Gottesmanbacteria bacterium]